MCHKIQGTAITLCNGQDMFGAKHDMYVFAENCKPFGSAVHWSWSTHYSKSAAGCELGCY